MAAPIPLRPDYDAAQLRVSPAALAILTRPGAGKAAGVVLPRCTTEATALHLEEIAGAVTPGAHAVLLLDQAGWHLSPRLKVPDNITLMPLRSKSPELNPVENVWQYMRDNWLSNRPPPMARDPWHGNGRPGSTSGVLSRSRRFGRSLPIGSTALGSVSSPARQRH